MKRFFDDEESKKYLKISLFTIATCIIIYILSRVADNLDTIVGCAIQVLSWIGSVLKPVFGGFIIAYILLPATRNLEAQLAKSGFFQKEHKKLTPRGAAVLILGLGVFLLLSVGITLIMATITRHVSFVDGQSFVAGINDLVKAFTQFYDEVIKMLAGIKIGSHNLAEYVQDLIDLLFRQSDLDLLSSADAIKSRVMAFAFSILFGAYFLIDGEGLIKYWSRTFHILMGDRVYDICRGILHDADITFSRYVRGQLLDALFMAVTISVVFSVIGVRFAPVIGIAAGIGNLIPYVGPFVAYGLTILVGIVGQDWKILLISLIAVSIIQAIDAGIVNPRLLGKSIRIHPLIVTTSLIIGNRIGGFFGMLVAAPCGGLFTLWFERLVEYIRKKRNMDIPPIQDESEPS